MTEEQEEELRAQFALYDADGSGTLTLDELKQATKHLGLAKGEVEKMFAQMDIDGNGEVTADEFVEGLKSTFADT